MLNDTRLQALCCECGNPRACRRPRNHRGENWWFRQVDNDWHRETGDLKCQACGRVTRHALLHDPRSCSRDHAEDMQRVALGYTHRHFDGGELVELRRRYRQAFPRNPYLKHRYSVRDARGVWEAGRRSVSALCGETLTLDREPEPSGAPPTEYVKPDDVDDTEHEDPATGLSWIELDCVDCLRVSNGLRLQHQRQLLQLELVLLVMRTGQLDAPAVTALRECIVDVLSTAKYGQP